jgi:hypothetical protein
MIPERLDRGSWLEAGLGVFALSLLVGGVMFVFGRSREDRRDYRERSKGPAAPGAVPAERHKNITTVAAR